MCVRQLWTARKIQPTWISCSCFLYLQVHNDIRGMPSCCSSCSRMASTTIRRVSECRHATVTLTAMILRGTKDRSCIFSWPRNFQAVSRSQNMQRIRPDNKVKEYSVANPRAWTKKSIHYCNGIHSTCPRFEDNASVPQWNHPD